MASYPKQVGLQQRVEAEKAYCSFVANREGEHQRLMDGLEKHCSSDQWQRSFDEGHGDRYVPNPAKFITEQRYLTTPRLAKRDVDKAEREAILASLEARSRYAN
jgi:hypothetical protein